MILDHEIVPQCIAEPNSFVGLMTLYESNYIILIHLFPKIRQYDADRLIKSPLGNDIHPVSYTHLTLPTILLV